MTSVLVAACLHVLVFLATLGTVMAFRSTLRYVVQSRLEAHYRKRGRLLPTPVVSHLLTSEIVISLVIGFGGLAMLFLWGSPFDELSTAALVVIGTSSLLLLVQSRISDQSYDPSTRMVAIALRFMSWPIAALTVGLALNPPLLQGIDTRVSIATMFACIGLSGIAAYFFNLPAYRKFVTTDRRHDDLIASIRVLSALEPFLSTGHLVEESLSQAKKARDAAFAMIKQGDTAKAEIWLIQGEAEVQYLDRLFLDRIQSSLLDDLRSRIAQSSEDVSAMRPEFANTGLSSGILDTIASKLDELQAKLADPPGSTAEAVEWLKPFAEVFDAVSETRIALRFLQNSHASIDNVVAELARGEQVEQLSLKLSLDVKELSSKREAVSDSLRRFQSGQYGHYSELVAGYYIIQQNLGEYLRNLSILQTELQGSFHVVPLLDGVTVYVPRHCRTDTPSQALIFAQPVEDAGRIEVTFDGTLLELPSEKKVELPLGPEGAYYDFPIAGKRGGTGVLRFRLADRQAGGTPIKVRIIPSEFERARDAAVILPLCGGITAIPLWYAGWVVRDAAQVGAVIGAIVAVAYFVVTWWRDR